MRRGGFAFLCLSVLFSCLLTASLFADERTENLVSIVLESFDPETKTADWVVTGSKFVTEDYPKLRYAQAWPEALFGANRDGYDYQVLGVNTRFDRKGYNYIEVIPVKENAEGEYESYPIPIPGRVKILDMWVWGSRYDYYLEAVVRDHRGVVHRLNMGSLKYTGWKNLRITIPPYIPQATDYVPHYENLELLKLMVWTTPTESVDDFYIYFDQIKVLTDSFVTRFDGDDLTVPDKVDEIWGGNQ